MHFNRKMSKILSIVGEGLGEIVLPLETILEDPETGIPNPIVDEIFEIIILSKHIFTGKVVIQGRLIKNMVYKARKRQKRFISHKTIIRDFMLEIPVPGMRRPITKKLIITEEEDFHLQLKVVEFQHDTMPGQIIWGESLHKHQENNDQQDSEQSLLLFNNTSLADSYQGNLEYDLKEVKPQQGQRISQKIHEKVFIKIKVVVSKYEIEEIPIIKRQKAYHCKVIN